MLAEHIGWVDGTRDVDEGKESRCHCLTDAMEGEHGVSLVELGMGQHGAVDHGFVIAKEMAPVANGNAETSEGVPQVHDLLGGDTRGDAL